MPVMQLEMDPAQLADIEKFERVLASEGAAAFEAGRARGRAMSRRAALQVAREYARAVAAPVAAGGGARADAPASGSPEHPQVDF